VYQKLNESNIQTKNSALIFIVSGVEPRNDFLGAFTSYEKARSCLKLYVEQASNRSDASKWLIKYTRFTIHSRIVNQNLTQQIVQEHREYKACYFAKTLEETSTAVNTITASFT